MYEYTRRGWSLSFTLSCIIITAAANPVAQPDAQNLSGRTTTTLQPVIPLTWADPSIIKVADTWYAMGTTDRNEHLPIANSNNLKDWTIVDTDAMPKLGKWVNAPDSTVNRGDHWTWAPETIQLPNGKFVMYYSALIPRTTDRPDRHCIGAAVATSVMGPYTPYDSSFACPLDKGGAIDASGFVDISGRVYALYKLDGNAIGLKDAQGKLSTPILLQEVSPEDGVTPIGAAKQIFDREESDGHLVEGPSLIYSTQVGKYILLLSSGHYDKDDYRMTYAYADRIEGPYTRPSGNLMETGMYGVRGPGGGSFAADGRHLAFHGIIQYSPLVRAMYIVNFDCRIEQDGTSVKCWTSVD